jgi:hypothetical protein
VFADYGGRATLDAGLTVSSSTTTVGARSGDFDAFFDINLRRFGAADWRVKAAKALREDVEDARPWHAPSIVGLWSMLDEYQAESGYLSADHGVLKRMKLDALDSYWLAECVLRTIDHELHCDLSEVLILSPDDPTSVQSVAQALHERHKVAVEMVPRVLIDDEESEVPDDLESKMREYADGKIVIFDESTTAFRTIAGLTRMIWAADREPDLSISILDLPTHQVKPAKIHRSFYGWPPLERQA